MISESDIVDTLRAALPDVQAIYLFGSQASGAATAQSDVDVAVLVPRPIEPTVRWELAQQLAARLSRDVDLVDLRAASSVVHAQVLAADRLLFDGDPYARAEFEMYALADYVDLNERRRGILEDVRARGTIHG